MRIIAVDDEKIALEALAGAIKAIVAEDEVITFRYPEDALEYAKENPLHAASKVLKVAAKVAATAATPIVAGVGVHQINKTIKEGFEGLAKKEG